MISVHVIVGLPGAGKTALAAASERRLGGVECSEPLRYGGKPVGKLFTAQRLARLDEMPLWKAVALLTSCQSGEDWQDWTFLLEGDRWAVPAFMQAVTISGAHLRMWEICAPASERDRRNRQKGAMWSSAFLHQREARLKRLSNEYPVSILFNPAGTDINMLALRVLEMALNPHVTIFPKVEAQ